VPTLQPARETETEGLREIKSSEENKQEFPRFFIRATPGRVALAKCPGAGIRSRGVARTLVPQLAIDPDSQDLDFSSRSLRRTGRAARSFSWPVSSFVFIKLSSVET